MFRNQIFDLERRWHVIAKRPLDNREVRVNLAYHSGDACPRPACWAPVLLTGENVETGWTRDKRCVWGRGEVDRERGRTGGRRGGIQSCRLDILGFDGLSFIFTAVFLRCIKVFNL